MLNKGKVLCQRTVFVQGQVWSLCKDFIKGWEPLKWFLFEILMVEVIIPQSIIQLTHRQTRLCSCSHQEYGCFCVAYPNLSVFGWACGRKSGYTEDAHTATWGTHGLKNWNVQARGLKPRTTASFTVAFWTAESLLICCLKTSQFSSTVAHQTGCKIVECMINHIQ